MKMAIFEQENALEATDSDLRLEMSKKRFFPPGDEVSNFIVPW